MTANRRGLVLQALSAALEARSNNGTELTAPVCAYDLAEKMELDVRLADVPSLEGMYSLAPRPAIVIGALRPSGRRMYTCGHEIGHHVFGHGTRIDELVDDEGPQAFDPEEFLAQTFAGFLLMPKAAVCNALHVRGWKAAGLNSEQLYRLAALFGVTCAAMLQHLRGMLNILPSNLKLDIDSKALREVRGRLVPASDGREQIVPVDTQWTRRPIDVEVDDIILAPASTNAEGPQLEEVESGTPAAAFRAIRPGHARLEHSPSGWANFVRVSRRGYVGRSIYRHLEDADEN